MTPHPRALGSALKHPHITTDFSEALIELITGVHKEVAACLEEMKHIHQFVIRRIGDEVLWSASMPCSLPDENAIRSRATENRTSAARRPSTASGSRTATGGACR